MIELATSQYLILSDETILG